MNKQEALQLAKSNNTSLKVLWEIVEKLNLIRIFIAIETDKSEFKKLLDEFFNKSLTTNTRKSEYRTCQAFVKKLN